MTEQTYIVFWYRNYKGEEGYRVAKPLSLRWGVSDWHKEPQWLMRAFDHDRQEEREFALADMKDLVNACDLNLKFSVGA